SWGILFGPLLCITAVVLSMTRTVSWFDGSTWFTSKTQQEWIGPALTAAAALLAAIEWIRQPRFWLLWLALLAGGLTCREVHFKGTSEGIYVGLVLLAIYAVRNLEAMTPYLTNRRAFTLLASGFATYAVTMSLDQGAWKFLPHFGTWGVSVEETFESCGHLLILASVFIAGRIPAPAAVQAMAVEPAKTETVRRAA